MPPKKNGYKMPDPLPVGLILQDIKKSQWQLGPSIGKGGFGEIYSAKNAGATSKTYPYVVKIEPHANGPLFVEMHFYSKNCKSEDISAYKLEKKLGNLGIPEFLGSGSHEHKGQKYRFIVMEKFGDDLHKLYMSNKKSLPVGTVYKIALQMIDVLEFIHSKGYVHADLKGANILFSVKNPNQAYLVDYGMTGKYSSEKVYKPDPKKMHNGTIEYLSRDAHCGVLTRRGDLEILAYNILHWLGGTLPWDSKLKDSKIVQSLKEESMKNIEDFVKKTLPPKVSTKIPLEFLKYINKLEFNQEPNYEFIKKLFKTALKEAKCPEKSPLVFKTDSNKRSSDGELPKPKRTTRKSKTEESTENTEDSEDEFVTKTTSRRRVLPKKGDDKDEEEKVPQKKLVAAKRTRRVATITSIVPEPEKDDSSSNGMVLNKEMQRLMVQMQERKNGVRKRPNKLNKSLDDVTETNVSSEDEEEKIDVKPLKNVRSRRRVLDV